MFLIKFYSFINLAMISFYVRCWKATLKSEKIRDDRDVPACYFLPMIHPSGICEVCAFTRDLPRAMAIKLDKNVVGVPSLSVSHESKQYKLNWELSQIGLRLTNGRQTLLHTKFSSRFVATSLLGLSLHTSLVDNSLDFSLPVFFSEEFILI